MPKTIQVELPAEIDAFVRAQIAAGDAADEAALVLKALKLYRELKTNHDQIRTLVQQSLDEADRGHVQPLDTEATKGQARIQLGRHCGE